MTSCLYKFVMSKMHKCQTKGCKKQQENRQGKERFFHMKFPTKRGLAMKRLHNIGNEPHGGQTQRIYVRFRCMISCIDWFVI